jgi:hypothetical protein
MASKKGKNTHLEHLEDEILNNGHAGGEKAIKILKELGKYLSGLGGPAVSITTKWDGAPAIVCGTDPADGRFFVGTKSVFSQTPKICKTQSDVQRLYDGTLANKLSTALRHLSKAGIKGVLQGDLMFTNDKKNETINNKSYITFRPNTITYAVDPKTPLGGEIRAAEIGIVFHTKYTGPSIAQMTASFDVKESDFHSGGVVWAQRATFTDITGQAGFSRQEKEAYEAAIRRAEGSLKIASGLADSIQSGGTLDFDTEFKKFFNAYIRGGTNNPPVKKAYHDFMVHLGEQFDANIIKLKTLDAQAKKAGRWLEMIDTMESNRRAFEMLIATYYNLQYAKNIIVQKLQAVKSLDMFVETSNGYEVTNNEGFVAITGDGAVKLIDRLEFSRLNFVVPKNW